VKTILVGILAASTFIAPAWAGGSGAGSSPSSSSSATANGGSGGAGGSATGGAATGGSATGGSASGNTSNVTVSLTTGTSGTSGTAADVAAGEPGSSAYNSKATVDYGGSYTVRSAPAIAAPSLTSTFSDTCMGSSSFGLSIVGFGATGGTTMVDDACVRRLDSREFRAMGLNDVALALLCQSPANRKAVEATGRSCPSAVAPAVATTSVNKVAEPTDPFVRRRLGMEPVDTAPSTLASGPSSTPAPASVTVSAVTNSEPESKPLADVVSDQK